MPIPPTGGKPKKKKTTKTPFRRMWYELMGQETTSTFTVTVTHGGPKRKFWDLFKQKGAGFDCEPSICSSDTIKTKPVAKYSDEQKMVRLMLKQSCEAAGLKYNEGYNTGTYCISYNWKTKKGGYTELRVLLGQSNAAYCLIQFIFPDGVGAEGKTIISTGPKQGDPSLSCVATINLANPNTERNLVELFTKLTTRS